MAREKAPVLFGRRMKRDTDGFAGFTRWVLKRGPFLFVLMDIHSRQCARGVVKIDGAYYSHAERASVATALNWLTAQRDRLVKSLTPERG